MQITRREKRLLLFLVVLAGVWLAYSYLLKPARGRLDTLERVIPEKQAALAQLVALRKQYTTLQNQSAQLQQQLAGQPANFALLAFLERAARQCSLTPAAMEEQPIPLDSDVTETAVSMDFQEISLEQLVRFLSALRSCPAALRIKSLHITRNASSDLLNVTVMISHLKASVPGPI
jgi:type II secretory pathway component PulM